MEIWKDIKNYESYYQISNFGRVKALYREFIGKNGVLKKYPERILKPDESSSSSTKYQRVSLSKNHKTKRFQVHRLVAEHFIDNPYNKPFINHIDNNGLNNKVSNLEWVTHSENMLHAQKQGRLFQSQSLGGKTGSKTNLNKMLKRVASMIGTVRGCYHINSLNGRNRNNEFTLNVTCIYCNNHYVRTLGYITNNSPTRCCKCPKPKIKI